MELDSDGQEQKDYRILQNGAHATEQPTTQKNKLEILISTFSKQIQSQSSAVCFEFRSFFSSTAYRGTLIIVVEESFISTRTLMTLKSLAATLFQWFYDSFPSSLRAEQSRYQTTSLL
jgi:hypothetical protein